MKHHTHNGGLPTKEWREMHGVKPKPKRRLTFAEILAGAAFFISLLALAFAAGMFDTP